MPEFANADEHRSFLRSHSMLPDGFRVATASFPFEPAEMPGSSTRMSLTAIALDDPTDCFGAMFTTNAFPGHPVVVGRRRLEEAELQAVIINNKISNVGAPGGEADTEAVCEAVARELGLSSGGAVFPSSTGIIGWRLPTQDMVQAVPALMDELSDASALPLALGIMTTDMFPKLHAIDLPPASPGQPPARILAVAKGAGMVEPHLATMLVYILTDADLERNDLRAILPQCVAPTFNCLSIDADQSTSDTLLALSSCRRALPGSTREARRDAFAEAALSVCAALAEDLVRNGEGVQHVLRVAVRGAPSEEAARKVGKRVVNSPLVKTAVAGNDPNIGRIAMAVGNGVAEAVEPQLAQKLREQLSVRLGGHSLMEKGSFTLTPDTEQAVHDHMLRAWLWRSVPQVTRPPVPIETAQSQPQSDANGEHHPAANDGEAAAAPPAWFVPGDAVAFQVPVDYPPHQRSVELEVDLGLGEAHCTVLGNDLTHEYVSINADYRS